MPLRIIVIGAGVAGLCAAVALHQAGHSVQVFDKSRLTGEVGSAILITPNGHRVLTRLGFNFAAARADEMTYFQPVDGITLHPLEAHDLADPRDQFGAPLYTIHRADLQRELLRLARGMDVRLGVKVVAADAEQGWIRTDDGAQYEADLVVAADGVHSVLRGAVLEDERAAAPVKSGLSAFRFLIPTETVQGDGQFQALQRVRGKGSSLFADTSKESEHHMVWFTCRGRQLQVFVGVHEDTQAKGDGSTDLKNLMLSEFGHYHPSLTHLIRQAPEVADWPLSIHDPLPTWHRGRVVLIGDAAHPMLPLGAQGANQAIEDAGALGALLGTGVQKSHIPRRLELFEKVRRLRASRVQTLSKVRLGKERDVESEVRKFADPPGSDVPTTFAERYMHDYG
ncbi:putative salicylate hydroxylase [Aspergillus steynii IBT 23096]|uniref:Putative salicylate hydroxylase n=1 Tax=Aspergillus steynii IBT 23096 TaxID=1392250 RepID=A0A2I2FUI0_9EURO|nr:putative salicylate hydroxylase [Aspergillus steynii IBT 23096]PLB44282.1 putative salicylate hydroxylase [Aspergillus steynii IBT 23096]